MARADAAGGDAGPSLRVSVAWSPAADDVRQVELSLPAGATLADALAQCSLVAWPLAAGLQAGVWGQPRPPGYRLRDGDRVEVWRPLQVDPMQARRLRQHARGRPRGTPARR